jgi:hypothetical protein
MMVHIVLDGRSDFMRYCGAAICGQSAGGMLFDNVRAAISFPMVREVSRGVDWPIRAAITKYTADRRRQA